MRKPKNLGRQALNKRSGRPRLKACDAQNMGHNRPHAVGFPIRNISERKLMDCLNRLGYDIEIKVKPAKKAVGHLLLAA
jgi:hypothetical protein